MNLSEYVSDYVNTVEHPDGPPTVDDIAEGYLDATLPPMLISHEEFQKKAQAFIPEIQYLWPAGKRRKA
jgi:hypothetical protein